VTKLMFLPSTSFMNCLYSYLELMISFSSAPGRALS